MNPCAFVLALLLLPGIALAQEPPAANLAGVNRDALSTVFVRDDRGVETKGQLLRLDSQSLVVLVNGTERAFDLAHVRRVDKRGDSLKNGAITGAVVGAVMGILAGGISDCHSAGNGYGPCGAGTRVGIAALSTGFYASVGVGIDAAITGRTTLYKAPTMASVAPAAGRLASFRVSVRW